MTRHRYAAPAWQWWPAAAAGLLPQLMMAAYLRDTGSWAAVVFVGIHVLALTLLATLALSCIRPARGAALGLFGAGAIGLAGVVGVAYTL